MMRKLEQICNTKLFLLMITQLYVSQKISISSKENIHRRKVTYFILTELLFLRLFVSFFKHIKMFLLY